MTSPAHPLHLLGESRTVKASSSNHRARSVPGDGYGLDFRGAFGSCRPVPSYVVGTPAAVVIGLSDLWSATFPYRSALIRDLGVRLQRLPVSELFSFVPLDMIKHSLFSDYCLLLL